MGKTVSAATLLTKLPPYQDKWIVVKDDQQVRDIMERIQVTHKRSIPYYDSICMYFDRPTIKQICNALYDFCIDNIEYDEETVDDQTTAIPTGILTRGYGDCKHYASFCGGILDALNRVAGKNIDWCYRFVSTNILNPTPHHVFVVVKDGSNRIAIDPTPGAGMNKAVWLVDKKVNASNMLRENIGSNNAAVNGPYFQMMAQTYSTGPDGNESQNKYFQDEPFLGLNHYVEDPYSVSGTNWNVTADDINKKIAAAYDAGLIPEKFTVTGDLAKWIYETNNKGWNFYYKWGVKPGYDPSDKLPTGYPRLTITDDFRLAIDKDQKLDDFRNDEIHALTAQANYLVNKYAAKPYPVKPQHIKNHSQLLEGNVDTRNLFNEARGDGIFKVIGKQINKTFNMVKAGYLKLYGSGNRNAFLGLIGINVFGWATKMKEKIDSGHWDAMANLWKGVGGNPDKLKNTIENGAKKKAILGGYSIGFDPVTDTAALIGAAAPIIALMLKYMDKDGKATEIATTLKQSLVDSGAFPDLQLKVGDSFDFLDKDGKWKPVQFEIDDKDNELLGGGDDKLPTDSFDPIDFAKKNPVIIAGAAAGLSWFLINRKKQKKNWVLPIGIGVGVWFLLNQLSDNSSSTDKRQILLDYVNQHATEGEKANVLAAIKSMTTDEINSTYTFLFNYVIPNKPVPQDSELYNKILLITDKYNIFS